MLGKLIHILDPLSGPNGSSREIKEWQEFVALKIHEALFKCIGEFFAGWACNGDGWGCHFPNIVDTIFTK